MKRYSLLLVAMLLGACTTTPTPSQRSDTQGSANNVVVVDGPATAAALTERYRNTARNCGSDSMPAFLCAGIILRVTTYGDSYDTWDPSPIAVDKGAVSFSFLRKDNNFARFAWSSTTPNGYVFYPIFGAPADKIDIPILCHYPMDGATDHRTGNACGMYSNVANSAPCDKLGITTAEQWASRYPPGTLGYHLCGFDVRDELNNQAGINFYTALQAKKLNPGYFDQQNELLLKVWSAGQGRVLPIQAFFYALPAGLTDARKNKQRFLSRTGIDLPIIKITLPTTASGDARFEYFAADQ